MKSIVTKASLFGVALCALIAFGGASFMAQAATENIAQLGFVAPYPEGEHEEGDLLEFTVESRNSEDAPEDATEDLAVVLSDNGGNGTFFASCEPGAGEVSEVAILAGESQASFCYSNDAANGYTVSVSMLDGTVTNSMPVTIVAPFVPPTIMVNNELFDGSLQEALDSAVEGTIITLSSGVHEFSEQIDITTPVSIVGEEGAVLKAVNPSWSTVNGHKHLLGIFAGTSESPVGISNVTIDANGMSHAVNTYNAAYGVLEDVTISNGKGAALTVNGSTIVATDLNTSGNAWGSVNVDPGSGVTLPSLFTLNSGTLSEDTQIWSDGKYVTETATVTINAEGYRKYAIDGTTILRWGNGELLGDITIEKGDLTTIYSSLATAIADAESGDTVIISAGTYELGQVVIDENLTIVGIDRDSVIIQPSGDTSPTSSLDAAAWILVNPSVEFNLSGVTLDGNSPTRKIARGIISYGTGTIENNAFKNIKSSKYIGMAVTVFGDMTISDNIFENIERIGVHIRKAYAGDSIGAGIVSGNTFTGKGEGDWVEYGIEVGASSYALLEGNTITNFKGVASSDGSESAGILITDYYGVGTEADVIGNTITGNTYGVVIGYADNDLTEATITDNNLGENDEYGVTATANAVVDAVGNWWGTLDETEMAAKISGDVSYSPWCADAACTFTTDVPVTQKSFEDEIEAEVETEEGAVTVEIPEDVVVTGPSGWDGEIIAPTVVTTTVKPTVENNFVATVVTSIEVGSPDHALVFDKPVKLVFEGQAGNLVGWSRAGVFTAITDECDSKTDPTLEDGADCFTEDDGHLIVWTKHFTTFTTYTVEEERRSSGGGSIARANALVAVPVIATETPAGQVLGETTFRFVATLRQGKAFNPSVTELQKALMNFGFNPGPFDGLFGPKTLAAVKAFQASRGLVTDGIVGPLTNAELNKAATVATTN